MNSTRPAIVASRSLVRGQPTERQSGEDRSATPSERTGEDNGAVTCTPPRRLSPAFQLPERIIGPALIVDLLPI